MFHLQLMSALVASAASLSRTDWPSLMQRLRREVVDLHSGEFCVDVSTYGDVVFEPKSREKCDTTFAKQCEDKTEQVCCISSESVKEIYKTIYLICVVKGVRHLGL